MALLGLAALTIAVFGLGALVVGLLLAVATLTGPWLATLIVAGGLFAVAGICVLAAKLGWSRTVGLLREPGDAQ